ncbi:MAG: sufD [Bacteroidota bacterium]|jgi:Fe-S cluster assembly protein SufD|nr:sufD [Bacteroidota bacterium]
METITKINTTEKLISRFESVKNSLFGDAKIRELAAEAFSRQGVPGRKHEEYKYVNMELALKGDLLLDSGVSVSSSFISSLRLVKDAIMIVIVNGRLSEEHTRFNNNISGLQIMSVADASSNSSFQKHYAQYADVNADPFIALNTLLASGGVFIHVDRNTVVEFPVHIIHVSSSAQSIIVNQRNLIVLEENAQLNVIESFLTANGSEKVFNNALTEIFVAENAVLNHNKIQEEAENGHLLNTTQVLQKKQSVFSTNNFTLSGMFIRNNLNIVLDDEHIESNLNGLYLTKGHQTVDNHTLVDHRKPNCNSNELYKGIIEEKSTATFNGKIFVRKDAQKTNAFQSNKNILLSDDGTINTKPQLEIYADDVKCSHGTSTGKLDEDKIFYLRARGLSEDSAKKLLMHAFASEVVEKVKIEELRDYIEQKITQRFA